VAVEAVRALHRRQARRLDRALRAGEAGRDGRGDEDVLHPPGEIRVALRGSVLPVDDPHLVLEGLARVVEGPGQRSDELDDRRLVADRQRQVGLGRGALRIDRGQPERQVALTVDHHGVGGGLRQELTPRLQRPAQAEALAIGVQRALARQLDLQGGCTRNPARRRSDERSTVAANVVDARQPGVVVRAPGRPVLQHEDVAARAELEVDGPHEGVSARKGLDRCELRVPLQVRHPDPAA